MGRVQESFPVSRVTHQENFVSLLFYFGLLSHQDKREGQPWLAIPNRTIQELVYSYLRDGYEDSDTFKVDLFLLNKLINKMAYHGEWQPVFSYLSDEVNKQTSIRDYITGEGVIKVFLLAYLNISDVFLVATEQEQNKGYVDIVLEPFEARHPDCPYSYLIELNYLTRSNFTKEKLEETITQGKQQLHKYKEDSRRQQRLNSKETKGILLVYRGWELVYQREVN